MKRIGAVSCLLVCSMFLAVTFAAPGQVDLSFDAGSGIDGDVSTMAALSGGKLLIGGYFTTTRGAARFGVARLNADGSADLDFSPPNLGELTVRCLAAQTDGKTIFGGSVRIPIDGGDRAIVQRLNQDGSIDSTFSLTGRWWEAISAVAGQADGKVIICGPFNTGVDAQRNCIARLNPNGSLDSGFNSGTLFDYQPSSVIVLGDGKILVGGLFTGSLKRLNENGTEDPTFNNSGVAIDGDARQIAIQPDGKILIAGFIRSVQGETRTHVARLTASGMLDRSFGSNLNIDSYVSAVLCQVDGKVIIAGQFRNINGTNVPGVARLNSDGTLDSAFAPAALPFGINAAALDSSGKLTVGGTSGSVARLTSDGIRDETFQSAFGTGAQLPATAIGLQSDGKIVAVFANVYDSHANSFVDRFTEEGSADPAFNAAILRGQATALHVVASGRIVAATLDGSSGTLVGRLSGLNADGTVDNEFQGGAANNWINAMLEQPDGKLLVAGAFTNYDGVNIDRIVRIRAQGGVDETFKPQTAIGSPFPNSDAATALALQPDGKILVGFQLNSCGCKEPKSIIRLNADGTYDQTFDSSGVLAVSIENLAVQSDGKILAGGFQFTERKTNGYHGIIRLNQNGTFDSTFKTSLRMGSDVKRIAFDAKGKIILNSNTAVIRLNDDGSLDQTFPDAGSTGFYSNVFDMVLQPDGNILVSGSFYGFNGESRARIARIFGTAVPIPLKVLAGTDGFGLKWSNAALRLQSAPQVSGPFLDVVDGKNSWTKVEGNGQVFYRLKGD